VNVFVSPLTLILACVVEAELKPSAVYQNIQELKEEGYLENTKELKITQLGEVMVL